MVRARMNIYGIIFSVISVCLISGCNIFEPEKRLASLCVQLSEPDAAALAKNQIFLDQMTCIIKDGSGTAVYDTTITASGEIFVFRAEGLDAGTRYDVILYGTTNSSIVVRTERTGIVLEKGMTRKVVLWWRAFTASLISPGQGSTLLNSTPQFHWNDVTGAATYELAADDQSSFNDPEIYTADVAVSNFTAPDSLADGTYYWKVQCTDSQGERGAWSEMGCFTIDTQGPASPALREPENGYTINESRPHFSWSNSGGAALYELIADDLGDFSSPEIKQNAITGTHFNSAEILSDRTYYWRVRAIDEHGNRGTWSDTWTFTLDSLGLLPAELFAPIHGSAVNNENLVFNWLDVNDVQIYELLVDNNTDFSSPEIHEGHLVHPDYTALNPLDYDTFFWKIRSRNDDEKWWSWSETWSFTLERITGTVADIDGNVYGTVKIGDQWWMAENLKVSHYRNGDPIYHADNSDEWKFMSSGAYCSYDDDPGNSDEYGYLYNWFALNDSRNIAPEGWHMPTDEEWQTLVDHLGGSLMVGSTLKEAGTAHWQFPNTGATNKSGFTALPGGLCDETGNFSDLGLKACFWSASEYNPGLAYTRVLSVDYLGISRPKYNKRNGFSVRLIKD